MNSQFRILSEKYIAENISDKELDELDMLLEENTILKEKLAQLLIQDIEIENAIKVAQHLKKNVRNNSNNKSAVLVKFLLVALVMLACFGAYYHFNNVKSPIGKVYDLVGACTIIRGDQKLKISEGIEILKGDKIELSERSYLILKSPGDSLIELDENTNILFADKEIDVKKGRIYTEITKEDKYFLQYTCPNNSLLTILGTSFDWQFNNYDNSSVLRVKEGVVKLSRDSNEERVAVNQNWLIPSQGKFIPLLKNDDVGQWRKNKQLFQDKEIYLSQLFQDKYFLNFWEHEITGIGNILLSSESSKSTVAMQCKDKGSSVLISTPYIQPFGKDLFFELDSYPIDFSGNVEFGYYLYIDKNIHSKISIQVLKQPNSDIVEITHHGFDFSKPEGDPSREEVFRKKTTNEIVLFFNGKFLSSLSTKRKKVDINEVGNDQNLVFDFELKSQGKKFCLVMYAKVLSEKGHITIPLKYMHATTSDDKLTELKLNSDK